MQIKLSEEEKKEGEKNTKKQVFHFLFLGWSY